MVTRPIFIPASEPPFFREVGITFEWHSGFSLSQKRKSIESLHAAAKLETLGEILEVSSKSAETVGVALSAFNLSFRHNVAENGVSVECAFQASKVFEHGGPYLDLLRVSSRQAKQDYRLQQSGKLQQFSFMGESWPLEPKTAFYDWLYIRALTSRSDLVSSLSDYTAFTDIEFNPQKSFSCQARSVAIFLSLKQGGMLEAALSSKQAFLRTIEMKPSVSPSERQGVLF